MKQKQIQIYSFGRECIAEREITPDITNLEVRLCHLK